ncbi:MAG: alpha/beta hydrolase [Colwellia sp.]|nr:alpha/beta hydrolase [Colwellia sp.]
MKLNRFLNNTPAITGRIRVLIASLLILLTLPSCVSHLIANQMISAPNQSLVGYELSNQFSNFDDGHQGLLEISGVSQSSLNLPTRKVSLSYVDIAAGDYGFSYLTKALMHENGKVRRITTQWQWLDPSCHASSLEENPAGVLVLLHGWGRNKNSLLSYGLSFAQQGYRVIIPNLRGHGDSTGDWVSFGAEEGRDISALMDKLAIEKYDVVGFSLGASAGLHTASLDKRVNQLVVVAPMHSLAQTIPKFARQSPGWLGKIVTRQKEDALALVNDISGYSYAQTSNSLSPARLITKPVLFIYGSIDNMSDFSLNKLLFDQGSKNNKLHRLEGLRHTHVLLHQFELMKPINQWLGLKELPVNGFASSNCTFKQFRT